MGGCLGTPGAAGIGSDIDTKGQRRGEVSLLASPR